MILLMKQCISQNKEKGEIILIKMVTTLFYNYPRDDLNLER